MQINTREEFISAAIQLLSRRPTANIMLIIDANEGLEVLDTQPSFIWKFGLLAAVEKMMDERYRAAMGAEEAQRKEKQANAEMEASLKPTEPGKAN